MADRNRRSLSVRGLTYQRIKDHCVATKQSVSGYIEQLVAADLDHRGVPVPTSIESKPGRSAPKAEYTGAHFTW